MATLNLDVLANLDLDLVSNSILYHVSRLKNIFNFNNYEQDLKELKGGFKNSTI